MKIYLLLTIITSMAWVSCTKPPLRATVVAVSGKVQVDGKTAELGSFVGSGSSIKTANSNDYIDVRFATDHLIRFKGTEVKLGDNLNHLSLRLNKGKIFVAASQLRKNQSMNFITSSTVAGVRGTKFLLEANDDETYICVCEGVVEAYKPGLSEDKKLVKAGQDLWIKKTESLKDPYDSPDMVNMTVNEFIDMGFTNL